MTDLQAEYDYCWSVFNRRFPDLARPALYIRKTRKTWGRCCWAEPYISLNRKLIDADVKFVRHVIFHEMCHLLHHNHSRNFYDLLKQFDEMQIQENESINKRVERLKARAQEIING